MGKLRHSLLKSLLAVAASLAIYCPHAADPKILTFFPSDFNGDGHADILWHNDATGDVYRMLMFGSSIYDGAMIYSEPDTAWKIVATGDFNADGKTDVLWRHDVTGQVYMMLMDYTGKPSGSGWFVYTEPNPDWKIIDGADLDGDGFGDILWWNAATGQVYVQLMRGILIFREGYLYEEPDTDWRIVAVARFTGTGGARQLLWRNARTGEVYLMFPSYSGNTFSTSGQVIYHEPDPAWKIVSAPDLDGNGKADILWRNESTGEVYGMLMNYSSIVSQAMIYHEPDIAWKIVATYDYDLDGRGDLLWRHEGDGRVYMMRVNGLGVVGGTSVYAEPDLAWKIMGPLEYARQREALP